MVLPEWEVGINERGEGGLFENLTRHQLSNPIFHTLQTEYDLFDECQYLVYDGYHVSFTTVLFEATLIWQVERVLQAP